MLYTTKESLLAKANEIDDGSYHLLSKEEYDKMLDNYYQTQVITEVNKQIAEKTKEIHSQYDKDLKELFGEEKNSDEKTYNFMKRKVNELKEKLDGNHDESEELKKLKADASKKISERDAEIEKLKTSITREKYRGQLTQAMAGLEFNDAIPENLRQMAINNNINELVANAREENGNVVWKINGVDAHDDAYNPLSAEAVINKVFADIKKPEQSGGGGGQPPKPKGTKLEPIKATEMLIKEGLRVGTRDFQDKFKELTGIGSEEE